MLLLLATGVSALVGLLQQSFPPLCPFPIDFTSFFGGKGVGGFPTCRDRSRNACSPSHKGRVSLGSGCTIITPTSVPCVRNSRYLRLYITPLGRARPFILDFRLDFMFAVATTHGTAQ